MNDIAVPVDAKPAKAKHVKAKALPVAKSKPLEIEMLPVKSLPYVRNARTHSVKQLAMIRASMIEFGWTNPVLLDGKRGIIAGHARVSEAMKLWSEGISIKRTTDGMVGAEEKTDVLGSILVTPDGWQAVRGIRVCGTSDDRSGEGRSVDYGDVNASQQLAASIYFSVHDDLVECSDVAAQSIKGAIAF